MYYFIALDEESRQKRNANYNFQMKKGILQNAIIETLFQCLMIMIIAVNVLMITQALPNLY